MNPDQPRDEFGRWTDGGADISADIVDTRWDKVAPARAENFEELSAWAKKEKTNVNAVKANEFWSKEFRNVKAIREYEATGKLPKSAANAEKVKQFSDNMKRAPGYKGVTFRGMRGELPWSKGQEVTLSNASSSSKSRTVAGAFLFKDQNNQFDKSVGTLLVVKSKTGYDITDVSGFSQHEVVLRKNTKYKVLDKKRKTVQWGALQKQADIVLLEEI